MIRLLAFALAMTADAAFAQQPANTPAADRPSECRASYAFERGTGKPLLSECSAPSPIPRPQVLGGEAAPDERMTAAIVYTGVDLSPYICTGVLLDDQHILTAGHCGCGSDYKVSFSERALNGGRVDSPLEVNGSPSLFDPLTCVRRPAPGNDLALIRLKNPFRLKDSSGQTGVSLLRLGYPVFALGYDVRDETMPGAPLKIVGYGETDKGLLGARMRASVPVLTQDCFEQPYRLSCAPFLEMILADRGGARAPHDTCGGDSGGPVFVRKTVQLPECTSNPHEDYNNKPLIEQPQDVVVAITSRAAPFTQPLNGGHCGGGGIYTLIGRKSVFAWFAANGVQPQKCVTKVQ